MSDRLEKPRDDVIREAQVARDEEHAGRVDGDPLSEWEDHMDGEASDELL